MSAHKEKTEAVSNIREENSATGVETVDTGWIRYCIHSRGSRSEDRWFFEPGMAALESDEVADHIVRTRETWAIHAEWYRVDYHTGEIPAADVIQKCLAGRRRGIDYANSEIATLEQQLSDCRPLGLPQPEPYDEPVHAPELVR